MLRPRSLAGLTLTGYGLLVLFGLVAHESTLAGVGSLLLGFLLLRGSLGSDALGPDEQQSASAENRLRRLVLAGVGLSACIGTLGYNLILGSTLSLPEWGILAYGAGLIAAAGHLHRRVGPVPVSTVVGWSFPLLLGPLLVFAIDAMLAGPASPGIRSLAGPLVSRALVAPTATGLALAGTSAQTHGSDLVLQTTEGSLTLGVGLVCAGIYPLVLFTGLLGLHLWHERPRPRRAMAYVLVGTIGVYLVNLLRLILLVKVGERWGMHWLHTVHAHAGWIMYGLFAIAFWLAIAPWIDETVGDPQRMAARGQSPARGQG